MLARLKPFWESINTSLWFLPSGLTVGAIVLAALAASLPFDVADDPGAVWWLHSGSAEHASNLLSSLLTSMITMATLAVSITMVVLTLAAGQLGPRLIRSFMADKRTQLMLGFLLATIVYLVLILRVVGDGVREDDVPHVAVSLGTGLVVTCVFVLLFFVHHLARSIVADTVIDRVGRDLDFAVSEMLPEGSAVEAKHQEFAADGARAQLMLRGGGYVQAVSYNGLVSCAREAGAVIDLHFRPGKHLLPGGCHGTIRPSAALTDATMNKVFDAVVLGPQPTAAQDLEFAIRQLVEVALRALSTGVNDPFTATAVVDRLGASLAHVMRRGTASGSWYDDDGNLRVTGRTTTFRGIVDAAYNQLRQAGEGQPAVLIRIQATLAELAEHVRHEEHWRVLTDHVGLVASAGKRSIHEPYDLQALDERTALARERLKACSPYNFREEQLQASSPR